MMKLLNKFLKKEQLVENISFSQFVAIYKNKKDSISLYKFLDGSIKKEYPTIKFRYNGDIDYNPLADKSLSHYVELNNILLEIYELKKKNIKQIELRLSTSLYESLKMVYVYDIFTRFIYENKDVGRYSPTSPHTIIDKNDKILFNTLIHI